MSIATWFHDYHQRSLSRVTGKLILLCLFLSIGTLIFGYDTNTFGGINAIPGFIKDFGEFDEATGKYYLPKARLSLMSSIAFVGKVAGCFAGGPIIEKINHRNTVYVVCAISIVGTVIESAARYRWEQYMVGRIILYFAVGVVEVAVPTYQTELVPAPARGLVVASIQLFISIGALFATAINRVHQFDTEVTGWLIGTAVQGVFPVLLLMGLWAVPLSPRWLISQGRTTEAIDVLRQIRPKHISDEEIEQEIMAVQSAMQEHASIEKGSWLDLFRGTNLRRTSIACIVFSLAQLTGTAFAGGYAPRFYQAVGLGQNAFNYQIIGSCLALIATTASMLAVDRLGRRTLLLWGGSACAVFFILMAGLGLIKNPNPNVSHLFVACFMLYSFIFIGTWGPVPYLLAAEIGSGALREKTMALGAALNALCAFIVSFVSPYLISALLSKVGFIFGGVFALATVYTYFFVPETKNRALEEIDACFAAKVSARKFEQYVVVGAAGLVGSMETHGATYHSQEKDAGAETDEKVAPVETSTGRQTV